MKKKNSKIQTLLNTESGKQFVRGFIATGLLATLPAPSSSTSAKKALQLALRGGIAIAAGTAASNALKQQRYTHAILSVAAGVCGMSLADRLFALSHTKESEDE
jgi:DNA-binding NarL/FixJ family response regulator